jgi:hypothetical protein
LDGALEADSTRFNVVLVGGLGDEGDRFEKHLSEEELQWRAEAKQQQTTYLKQWSQVFANYRKLMSEAPAVVDEKRTEHQLKLAAARKELQRLNSIRAQYYEQEKSLEPGVQSHGRVWLFLNTVSLSDPVASN